MRASVGPRSAGRTRSRVDAGRPPDALRRCLRRRLREQVQPYTQSSSLQSQERCFIQCAALALKHHRLVRLEPASRQRFDEVGCRTGNVARRIEILDSDDPDATRGTCVEPARESGDQRAGVQRARSVKAQNVRDMASREMPPLRCAIWLAGFRLESAPLCGFGEASVDRLSRTLQPLHSVRSSVAPRDHRGQAATVTVELFKVVARLAERRGSESRVRLAGGAAFSGARISCRTRRCGGRCWPIVVIARALYCQWMLSRTRRTRPASDGSADQAYAAVAALEGTAWARCWCCCRQLAKSAAVLQLGADGADLLGDAAAVRTSRAAVGRVRGAGGVCAADRADVARLAAARDHAADVDDDHRRAVR